MKKPNPHITEEHIVAFLDGELHVSSDFKRELHADPSLSLVAKEHTAISKSIAKSHSDERFTLSSSLDSSTMKMLARAVKAQKPVHTAAPVPSAAPVRSTPPQRSVKYLWAKRTSVGFAFAALLAMLWMNFNGKNEQITQVPVPTQINKTPAPEQVAPNTTQQVQLTPASQLATAASSAVPTAVAAPQIATKKNVEAPSHVASKDIAANASPTPDASTAIAPEKNDPADAMISHRYAKLIKATRMVEVTQQDKM